MTPSERNRDNPHLAEVRALTERFKAGGQRAFGAFQELANTLLTVTVMDMGSTLVLRQAPGDRRRRAVLTGRNTNAVRLRNGHYLRITLGLYLDPEADDWLKVGQSSYQYQLDEGGDRWIFRYDYLRDPAGEYEQPPDAYRHPYAHVQIRDDLEENVLAPDEALETLHFPTGRISLEAVIRCLAVQFKVPCAQEEGIWLPVLTEAETLFQAIAHRPPSGPGGAFHPDEAT
jgi:hypothetical protein